MKSEKCDIGLNPKRWDDYMMFLKGKGWFVESTGDSQTPGIGTPRYVARDASGAEIVLLGNGLISRTPNGRTFVEEFRHQTATTQITSNNKRSKKARKVRCDCDLETAAEQELMRAEQEFQAVRKKAGLSVAKMHK